MNTIMEWITANCLDILIAIAIVFVGFRVAKYIRKYLKKILLKIGLDEVLSSLLSNIGYAAFLVFIVISSLQRLGFDTTSLIAMVGAMGLAVGLAFKDTLSNFAAGILIIILKPFDLGDYIEGAGISGRVQAVELFSTKLLTPDNKEIIVPNSMIYADTITNYSAMEERRIDLIFGVSYEDDLKKVRKILQDEVKKNKKILHDTHECTIAVKELADSSVNLVCRPWVKTDDYWDVYFDLVESVKLAFDKNKITIPYPRVERISIAPTTQLNESNNKV